MIATLPLAWNRSEIRGAVARGFGGSRGWTAAQHRASDRSDKNRHPPNGSLGSSLAAV